MYGPVGLVDCLSVRCFCLLGVQGSWVGMQGVGFGVRGWGFGVWGLGFLVWGLESGVRVWVLVFGVWGLGLRAQDNSLGF